MWELFTKFRGTRVFVQTQTPPNPRALPLTQLRDFLVSRSPLTNLWLAVFFTLSLSLLVLPRPVKRARRSNIQWAIVKAGRECRYQDIKVLQDATDDFLPEWVDDLRSSNLVWGVACGGLALTALFWQQSDTWANERLLDFLMRFGLFMAMLAVMGVCLALVHFAFPTPGVTHASDWWITSCWEAVKEWVANVDVNDIVVEPETMKDGKITDEEIRAFKKAKDRESVDDFFAARRSPVADCAKSKVSPDRAPPLKSSTEPPPDKKTQKTIIMQDMREELMYDVRQRVGTHGLEKVLQTMEKKLMPVRMAFPDTKSPEVQTGMSSRQPSLPSHRFEAGHPMRERMTRMVHLALQQHDRDAQAWFAAMRAMTRELSADRRPAPSTFSDSSSANDTKACASIPPFSQTTKASNVVSPTTNNVTVSSSAPLSSSNNGNECQKTAMPKEDIPSAKHTSPSAARSTTTTTTSSARAPYFFPRPENFEAFNPQASSSSTPPCSLFPPPRTSSLLPQQPQTPTIRPQRPLSEVPRSDSTSSLATTVEMDSVSECGSGSTVSCFLDVSDDGDDSDWEEEDHGEGYLVVVGGSHF